MVLLTDANIKTMGDLNLKKIGEAMDFKLANFQKEISDDKIVGSLEKLRLPQITAQSSSTESKNFKSYK